VPRSPERDFASAGFDSYNYLGVGLVIFSPNQQASSSHKRWP
jgi:hypothetical protein